MEIDNGSKIFRLDIQEQIASSSAQTDVPFSDAVSLYERVVQARHALEDPSFLSEYPEGANKYRAREIAAGRIAVLSNMEYQLEGHLIDTPLTDETIQQEFFE